MEIDYKGEPIEQPMYKFEEELVFSGSNNCNKKMAICIGYNPALSCKYLDATNKRLCAQLKELGYDGYYLFNLYPEITSHKEQLNLNDKNNINSLKYLKKMVNQKKTQCGLIILFFGRTAELNDEQVDFLRELIADKELDVKITTSKGEFIHPGSIGKIDLTECKLEYIRKSNGSFIRIKQ